MILDKWLVEIGLNHFEPDLLDGNRTISFEEILAKDERSAMIIGFEQFEKRCKYEPAMKLKMIKLGLTVYNCRPISAIVID